MVDNFPHPPQITRGGSGALSIQGPSFPQARRGPSPNRLPMSHYIKKDVSLSFSNPEYGVARLWVGGLEPSRRDSGLGDSRRC